MELTHREIRYRIETLSTKINTNHHMQLRARESLEKSKLVEECQKLERERRRYLELEDKFIPD